MKWVNDDMSPHTITAGTVPNNRPTPAVAFDSGLINFGESFPFVFDKACEYSYYWTVHPWMTGKVSVS